jgi:hypothetical protein
MTRRLLSFTVARVPVSWRLYGLALRGRTASTAREGSCWWMTAGLCGGWNDRVEPRGANPRTSRLEN